MIPRYSPKTASYSIPDTLYYGSYETTHRSRLQTDFPAPSDLLAAEIDTIGITPAKADAIRALSSMVHDKKLHFSYSSDLNTTRKRLLSLGPLGHKNYDDVFPKNDLIIRKALDQRLVDKFL